MIKKHQTRIQNGHWIINKYIAHRGLHDEFTPENSLSAFQKAIDKDYAIELDVQLIADGTVIVFHDTKLSRLTGKDGYVSTLDKEQFNDLRLNGTSEKVPTLKQVLELVKGKVPLLIEVKNSLKVGELESAVNALLKNYKGDFAIQSFNPFTLKWFKDNNPNILRGQLSSFFKNDDLSLIKKIALKKLRLNKISCPDFISYNAENLPNRFVSKADLPTICWTIKNQEEYYKVVKYVDNIIFEGFDPVI